MFRISLIDYLNAAPLIHGFKQGLIEEPLQLKYQVPSQCADELRSGQVDGGLISSIEYLRIPDLHIMPGLCIASPCRVRSVLLLSKVAPEKIRSLALDTSSRTSSVLVQLLLEECYNHRPRIDHSPPHADDMLKNHDAALLIGDTAMRASKEGLYVLDLAEEWYEWTGFPFVFALWCIRRDAVVEPFDPRRLHSMFRKSYEMGIHQLPHIIEGARRSVGWTRLELEEYFTKNIHYHLGNDEMKGLDLFFAKAVEKGFAERRKPLCFLEPLASN